jgi:hypothetical protein
MDSLDQSGTATQREPEVEAATAVEPKPERRAPTAGAGLEDRRLEDRRLEDRRLEDQRTAGATDQRCSPDPFVATDRYRLTMPYADRI